MRTNFPVESEKSATSVTSLTAKDLTRNIKSNRPVTCYGGRVRLCRTLIRLLINGSTESRPTVTPPRLVPKADLSPIRVTTADLSPIRVTTADLSPIRVTTADLSPIRVTTADLSRHSSARRSDGGFTMIEIAIAVGVIGFALVAIIGILPRGMNVQKDNREDTIISQDAPYFLNAIRNGEMRTANNFLTGYVETIFVTNIDNGTITVTTNSNPNLVSGVINDLITDSNIVGILSTPAYDTFRLPGVTNEVTAIVRAMTGSAIQQNGSNSATAFRYQLTVEIDPWNSISFDSTNFNGFFGGSTESNSRYIRFTEVPYLMSSMHEVRLKFAWPVLPNGNIGPNRQTYRSLISSHLTNYNNNEFWYFQPNSYMTNLL
jgi:type II secretory pathway pseudopilin PulG